MVHIFWAGGEIEFCILLERFRGGYFVLLLSLLLIPGLDFVSVFELVCLLLFRRSGSLQGCPRGLGWNCPVEHAVLALGSLF